MLYGRSTIITAGLLSVTAASVSAQSQGSSLATATVIDTRVEWAAHATAVKAGRTALANAGNETRQAVGPATHIASKAARREGAEASLEALVTISYW